MLDKVIKLIEATEGLTVNFKVGKESELVIKGDFIAMAKLGAALAEADSKESEKERKIMELENEISRLKC